MNIPRISTMNMTKQIHTITGGLVSWIPMDAAG